VECYPRCVAENGAHYLPVMVISGQYNEHEAMREAYGLGADDFLRKPFKRQSDALSDSIRNRLARKRTARNHAACAIASTSAHIGPAALLRDAGAARCAHPHHLTGETRWRPRAHPRAGTFPLSCPTGPDGPLGTPARPRAGEAYTHFTAMGGTPGSASKPRPVSTRTSRPTLAKRPFFSRTIATVATRFMSSVVIEESQFRGLRTHPWARVRALVDDLERVARNPSARRPFLEALFPEHSGKRALHFPPHARKEAALFPRIAGKRGSGGKRAPERAHLPGICGARFANLGA